MLLPTSDHFPSLLLIAAFSAKMSNTEVLKQLKIKTNSLKRLHKELAMYVKERDVEQAKVDKLKAAGADPSDLKQAAS